ncbi:MAG: arginase family protein [Nitrospirae bacterium]|nr:arginase family protein [Nitrospirota bacterium]
MAEMQEYGIEVATAPRMRASGAPDVAGKIRARVSRPQLDGFWVHLDLDILDAGVMPAVDSPENPAPIMAISVFRSPSSGAVASSTSSSPNLVSPRV